GKYVGGLNAPIPGGAQGLVANTGKMYITFTSGASGQAKGFEAYWVTIADTSIKTPVSDFTFPTPLYTNSAALFQSTSQGKNLAYAWDFDPPAKKGGLEGGKKEFDRYSWSIAGTYDVKLITSNCVGVDEITKQVTVIDPTAAPAVNFYADKIRVPVLSKV